MIKWISAFVVIFVALSSFAETRDLHPELKTEIKEKSQSRKYNGDVTFTLQGRRYDDPFANARWGRFSTKLKIEGQYDSWLVGKLALLQDLTSGASAYQMGVKEVGPTSGLYVDEATVAVKAPEGFEAKAGILGVELNPIFSQLFPQSQPGGELSYNTDWESNWGTSAIEFSASQSIPGSRGSENGNAITDQGTLPLMTVGIIYGEIKNEITNTKFRLSASHFEYTDLSTSAAGNSLRLGSSVVGTKDFQFLYEYRGKEYAASVAQTVGLGHEIEFKASTISNERAPSELRDGWQTRLSYTHKFNRWQIIPSYVQFRIEGDALPALYSIPSVGYTNRQGFGLGLKAEFPKDKFSVFAGYTNANALVKTGENMNATSASTYQADREIFTIGTEVKYDIF